MGTRTSAPARCERSPPSPPPGAIFCPPSPGMCLPLRRGNRLHRRRRGGKYPTPPTKSVPYSRTRRSGEEGFKSLEPQACVQGSWMAREAGESARHRCGEIAHLCKVRQDRGVTTCNNGGLQSALRLLARCPLSSTVLIERTGSGTFTGKSMRRRAPITYYQIPRSRSDEVRLARHWK